MFDLAAFFNQVIEKEIAKIHKGSEQQIKAHELQTKRLAKKKLVRAEKEEIV